MTETNDEFVPIRGITKEARHKKILLPSADNSDYDITTPSVVPSTASNTGVGIPTLEYIYMTNPLVHRAINIRANRVIGDGFELLPAEGNLVNPEIANEAMDKCMEFLERINYLSFFRQSAVNAYVAGNEWSEKIYNQAGMLINVNHGDFRTIDYRRDFVFNKVLLDDKGEPVGYWQYIENLAYLYASLSTLGVVDTEENLIDARNRLNDKESYTVYDENGQPIALITRRPNYMFLKQSEIAHLSFNNLNDNYFGVSLIIPAYNSIQQLDDITFATAEMVNELGYPKPLVYVGDKDNPPTQKLNDAAQTAITDPVRKEGFVLPYYMKMDYLRNDAASDISAYPQWYITAVSIGLKVPRELLTGEGEANFATTKQNSTDFEKDIEADKRQLERYIRDILSDYLKSRGYLSSDVGLCTYTPTIKWPQAVTEDEALREKMVLEKWQAGLITRSEAREKLGLPEIEDIGAANVFVNEAKKPEAPQEAADINQPRTPRPDEAITSIVDEATQAKPPSAIEQRDHVIPETVQSANNTISQTAQHRLEDRRVINPELNETFNTVHANYKGIAQKVIGKKIKSVGKAKANKIRDAIVNGLANGKKLINITKQVQQTGDLEKYEADRIMRTEVSTLANSGKLENAQAKNLKYKIWEASQEEPGEPCHKLDNKRIPIEANFEVDYNGNKWKGQSPPLHPNCKCRMRFEGE